MDFTVNHGRGVRAWRRGLLVALAAALLAACGGTSGQSTGGTPTLNWYIFNAASRAREGQRVQLWFDPARLHLFDPDSGAHLTR